MSKKQEENRDVFDVVSDYLVNGAAGAAIGAGLMRGSHKLDKFLKKRNPKREITTHPKGDAYVRRNLTELGALGGGGIGLFGTRLGKQAEELKKEQRRK